VNKTGFCITGLPQTSVMPIIWELNATTNLSGGFSAGITKSGMISERLPPNDLNDSFIYL